MLTERSMHRSGKIRLGIVMYTPMIGGAELYCRDLLRGLDRTQFDVTLFCEPWDEFVEFLDLPHCPPTTVCYVRMREVGGHYGAKELTDVSAPKQLRAWEKLLLRATKAQQRMASPLAKVPGRLARAVMEIVLLVVNAVRLRAAFRRHPVDVLHVINGGYPGASSAQLAGWAARRVGCRSATMSICNTPVARHFPKALDRVLDALVRRTFDALIVPGDYIRTLLIKLRGFSPEHITLISEGVAEPAAYGATPAPLPAGHSATIAMVAGFLPHKGHRFLFEAIARLRTEHPQLHAMLVGDGPTLVEMRTLAAHLDIADAVTFTGFLPLPQALERIAAAHLFVHPALMEGMPYVILHAMSIGRPVIATPVGGIPDVVIDGTTGLLVPAGDVTALARAIGALLRAPDRLAAMGAAGRHRYEAEHAVSVMVERHASLFRTLATRA